MKGFSIIVCCYNSAPLLPKTLMHLAQLSRPEGYGVELVIVDNNSNDDTAQVARRSWQACQAPYPLTVVTEPEPGLSFARKRGIATGCYDYLLFCDDDNWLEPDYLCRAREILDTDNTIGMLGGLGLPFYESLPSYWPADFYIYGSGPQAADSGPVQRLHGAGVVLRRQAYDKLQAAAFHFCLTDRKAEALTSGGDYELCYAVAMAGYQIWYDKGLVFTHQITPDRLTRAYAKRFIRESAPAVSVLDVYSHLARHPRHPMTSFAARQLKYLLHHTKELGRSTYTKIRFHRNEQVVFLETFHQRYHLRRLVCILGDVPRCRKTFRSLIALSGRLRRLPAAGSSFPDAG